MLSRKILIAGLGLTAVLGLSACVDDGYGYGGGVGYVSDGWDPYYGGFNADPYWGWYGDYYYPGSGYYVYDRHRGRHRWNGSQQNYWRGRSQNWNNARRDIRPMWRDFGGARGGVQGGRGPGSGGFHGGGGRGPGGGVAPGGGGGRGPGGGGGGSHGGGGFHGGGHRH